LFLNYLEIIPVVAETKSFSKASKLLHLSQPAISNKVQAMEAYYGVKLFNRTSHGVTLTEAGKIVCGYAVRFLALANAMEKDLDKLLNIDHSYLTIGASCTAGNYAMPCSIRAFKEKYPEVSVKLDIGNTQNILDKLKNKEIDIAVVEGKVANSDYITKYINTSNLVFIASNNRRKHKDILSLKELKTRPFVLREKGAAIRVVFEKALTKHGYKIEDFNIVSEMTSIHSVKAAVEEELGISIVPAISIENELYAGNLKIIKIKELDSNLELDIYLVYLKHEEPSLIAQKFIKFITHPEKTQFCWDLKRFM